MRKAFAEICLKILLDGTDRRGKPKKQHDATEKMLDTAEIIRYNYYAMAV